MTSIRRALLTLPFAVAGVLNVLLCVARPLHWRSEHIAGYGFLFLMPWARLLDRGWSDGIKRSDCTKLKNGEAYIHSIDNVQDWKYSARALVLATTTRPRGQRDDPGFVLA